MHGRTLEPTPEQPETFPGRAGRPAGPSARCEGALTPAGRRDHGQGGFERLPEPAGEGEGPEALAPRAAQPGSGLRRALRDVDGEGRILAAFRGWRRAPQEVGGLRDRRSDRRGGGRAPQVSGVPSRPHSIMTPATPARSHGSDGERPARPVHRKRREGRGGELRFGLGGGGERQGQGDDEGQGAHRGPLGPQPTPSRAPGVLARGSAIPAARARGCVPRGRARTRATGSAGREDGRRRRGSGGEIGGIRFLTGSPPS